MATEIVMPRLSDTMDAGTIARWLKREGDAVSKGEILAEIETDKANMELESFSAGVLAQILVPEGQSANLGQPIAVVAANEEEAQSLRSGAAKPDQSQEAGAAGAATESQAEQPGDGRTEQQAVAQGRTGGEPVDVPAAEAPPAQVQRNGATEQTAPAGRIKASPLARRMAEEHGLDLHQIRGTGPGGRITKEDVQAFMREASPAPAPAPTPQRAPEPAPASAAQRDTGGRAAQPVQMTRMQQTIARRMTESRFSAPEFVLVSEVDMTAARALLRDIAAVEGAPKVGPNDLLIKAVASALGQHPEANAGWENDTIVRYGRINVGFAVALPDGLVVPVVQDADRKTLGQIAVEAKELIAKAQGGKLAPRDYEHGTFSISNLGMYGIDQFTPVINPPEACILGVGAITPTPVVIDGEVVVRDRMRLTLSCDHRVLYGAQGAEFLRTLRRMLETPYLIIL